MGKRGVWQRWKRIATSVRCSDLYDTSELKRSTCKNDGYGEILPSFTRQIVSILNITRRTKVVDIGSGLGLFSLDLAALANCHVLGVEVRQDLHQRSVEILQQTASLGLDVNFIHGDATQDEVHFNDYDVVICCNTLWSSDTNYRLLLKLSVELKPNAKLLVLEQMGSHRYHEGSSKRSDVLGLAFDLPPLRLDSGSDSVSWTASSLPYYIYSKKNTPTSIRKEIHGERARTTECMQKEINVRNSRVSKGLALAEKKRKREHKEGEEELQALTLPPTQDTTKVPHKKVKKRKEDNGRMRVAVGQFIAVYPDATKDPHAPFWIAQVNKVHNKSTISVSWLESEEADREYPERLAA